MADNQTNRLSELLRNYNGEGAATTNLNMLAQGLRSRNKEPMNKLKPFSLQDFLDMSALATSPVPVVGDVVGLGADAYRFGTDPSSRTPLNFGLAALGLIPFVPSMGAAAGLFKGSAGPAMGGNQIGAVNPSKVFYRGTTPGDVRRIKTGDGFWDSLLFAANNKDTALSYGKHITEFTPAQDARILVEGSREFRNLGGAKTNGKNMLQWASDITKNAKENGYDAVQFKRQGDIGTAIINPDKFLSK